MPSTSIKLNTKSLAVLFLMLLPNATAHAQSNIKPQKNKKLNIYDQIQLADNSATYLKYSNLSRRIWIDWPSGVINKTVKILKKNTNPELIGAEDSLRFVSRKSFEQEGVQYFGIITAERSSSNDGGGQCGAGEENYFISYKLTNKNKIQEIFRQLIYSCLSGMALDDGDGNNNDYSISTEGSNVVFRWLSFPGTENYIIGHYNFLTNKMELKEILRENAPLN